MSANKYLGSHIQYDVILKKNIMVSMRDGTKLATDIYLPAISGEIVEGKFPTVIERTPYDNASPRLVDTARFYASRGYVAVMQDVRGRGESEGDWLYLLNEKDESLDGYDTLSWIVDQKWSDGKIGTMGLSYTGATQHALALANPPGLTTQFILDSGYNYHTHTVRSGGAFCSGIFVPYAFRMARDGKEAQANPNIRKNLIECFPDLKDWMNRLPILKGESPLSQAPTYENMLLTMASKGKYDEFWKNPGANIEEHIDDYPDIPIFMLTSWYGHHVWATTTKLIEFKKRLKSPIKIIIGTWLHGYETLLDPYSGEVNFGQDSILHNIEDFRLKWFDQFLKEIDTNVLDGPIAKIFVMGTSETKRDVNGSLIHGGYWKNSDVWPIEGTNFENYYLHANGLLNTIQPDNQEPPTQFTFDPNNPVPTLGGCIQTPKVGGIVSGGAFDQKGRPDKFFMCKDNLRFSEREDVMVFETEPLQEPIEIVGNITVSLSASSSAKDTDFTAKLIDKYPVSEDFPNGFDMNLCDGIIRARFRNDRTKEELMIPGDIYEFEINLQATGNVFKKGHRIRLDISSSNFPQFDVNPNTGDPLWSSKTTISAKQQIHHDKNNISFITLPVIKQDIHKQN